MGKRTDLNVRIGRQSDLVANVLACAGSVSPSEWHDGATWYRRAHGLASDLGGPLGARTGAGVIAALSPQNGWADNVVLARRAYAQGRATGHTGLFCARADAILAGADPLDVLGGLKVRPFFGLIADPDHPTLVVIDRHAYDIAVGRVTCDAERKALELRGGYDWVASAFRIAAAVLNVTPSVLQAATWVSWRTRKGSTDHPSILEPDNEHVLAALALAERDADAAYAATEF